MTILTLSPAAAFKALALGGMALAGLAIAALTGMGADTNAFRSGFLGLTAISGLALSVIYLTGRDSTARSITAIAVLGLLSIAMLFGSGRWLDAVAAGAILLTPVLAMTTPRQGLAVTAPYAAAAAGLIAVAAPLEALQGGLLADLAPVAGLSLVIGLFPLSAWSGWIFERAPSGVLGALIAAQAAFVTGFETIHPTPGPLEHAALAGLGLLSALVALSRTEPRRAMAGLCASALALLAYAHSLTPGLGKPDILLTASMTIALPGLLLTVGALEARRGTLCLARPSGSFESTPRLANAMLLFGLLTAGFPLSLAYVGEDLALQQGFAAEPTIILIWLAVIALNAIMALKLFLFLCHGKAEKQNGIDLQPVKYAAACLAIASLFVAGFFVP